MQNEAGLFSTLLNLFESTSSSDSFNDSYFDDAPGPLDYGINPSTGLPMISSLLDADGNLFCEQPTIFESSNSTTLFDDPSCCSSSFDDSSASVSPFTSEIGSKKGGAKSRLVSGRLRT